ncbi:MAG: hypothetical protein Ct9H90mP15_03830 [Candidatus Neomarinimicrobiota bacterium]|nr:MAG: hypothetical protein Ct9H90mP15_03830 [Candidatus Neomarinimicrobiota bacterium]
MYLGMLSLDFLLNMFENQTNPLQFILLNLTMGQLLCIAMMIGGIVIWFTGYKTATEN